LSQDFHKQVQMNLLKSSQWFQCASGQEVFLSVGMHDKFAISTLNFF